MLHIVNKSPALTRSLESCVRLSRPGQSLLLIEDGIYAATRADTVASLKHLKLYVLQPDVEARGMKGRIVEGVAAVDYAGFVDLVAEHSSNQSWL